MPQSKSPPCMILAGGQGVRMGGVDKGLLQVAGARMIDHVLARIAPQCGPVAINANGDPARWSAFGLPVLPDTLPDGVDAFPGPLAGILAALDWAETVGASHVVTVPADTPFLPTGLVAGLLHVAGTGCAVAASPDAGGELRPHPTCGLWPIILRDDLRAALQSGQRRVMHWARTQDAGLARFESQPVDPFFNVNTPDDIAAANRLVLL